MEELKNKLRGIIEGLDYYLYDITYQQEEENYILRVMIDNDTYINIDDCVKVSHEISDILDELDPFSEPYMLEVTSAGAERELRNSDEVKRAVGKPVYIETIEQKFDGILEKFSDDILVVKHRNKRVSKVNYMDVNFIRLTILL